MKEWKEITLQIVYAKLEVSMDKFISIGAHVPGIEKMIDKMHFGLI